MPSSSRLCIGGLPNNLNIIAWDYRIPPIKESEVFRDKLNSINGAILSEYDLVVIKQKEDIEIGDIVNCVIPGYYNISTSHNLLTVIRKAGELYYSCRDSSGKIFKISVYHLVKPGELLLQHKLNFKNKNIKLE